MRVLDLRTPYVCLKKRSALKATFPEGAVDRAAQSKEHVCRLFYELGRDSHSINLLKTKRLKKGSAPETLPEHGQKHELLYVVNMP